MAMKSKGRAPLYLRAFRLSRLAVHAARGWVLSHRLASSSPVKREEIIRTWSRQLLRLLGVDIAFHGAPNELPPGAVLVCNHISWLDVFAVYTHTPCIFVSKAEVRDWPLIGGVVVRAGILFIERGNARHARSVNGRIVAALEEGAIISVFPEGIAGEGDVLHGFHAALFQPAIEANATLIPIALRYTDVEGQHCSAPTYAGATTLMQSLWGIVSHAGLRAELHFLPALSAAEKQRRELARHTEAVIAAKLGVAVKRKSSETRADPPDAPQSSDLPPPNPDPAPADSA